MSGQVALPGRIVDLLGLIAYAELSASLRLAEDAMLAPSLSDKAEIGAMAAAEFGHFQRIGAYLRARGADPEAAMTPFTAQVDAFHARTQPADWLEGLVKANVGDGLAADFYRAVAERVEPTVRAEIIGVLDDLGHSRFAVGRVRDAIAADPSVAGRLALWARRLVGEAMAQAQHVAVEHPGLAELVTGDAADDLTAVAMLFADLTDRHAARMRALGLLS